MRLSALLAFLVLISGTVAAAEPHPCVLFVGIWDRAAPMVTVAARDNGIEALIARPGELAATGADAPLSRAALVLVLNLEPAEAAKLQPRLAREIAARPTLKVLALDKRGVHADLIQAGLLSEDPRVAAYWRPNGDVNLARLMRYLSATYLGGAGPIEAPVPVPDSGYYEPGHAESFADFASLRAFKLAAGRWRDDAPRAVMIIQQSFWITHDTKVVDAQVAALERLGIAVVVVFGDRQQQVEELITAAKPEALIEDRHGAMWDSKRALERFDVPYLRPISMLAYTVDEWRADPRGMSRRDVGLFMTVQESWGTLEPVVVGGLQTDISGFKLHAPIADGVEKFARRTKAWLDLRRKANPDKRIAIIYYNKGLGLDDLMRGSPTGAFLDGPESAVRFLPQLAQHGYAVSPLPHDSHELIDWIKQRGRNVGPWAPAELAALVEHGDPVLIPEARYLQWFESKLSPAGRAAVIERFGPPPGKIMTIERGGARFVVIPRIQLGNVLLAPQPERGEKQDDKLLHSRDVPPPHNYLAFYWWLQEEYHADALIHWGTHGTVELLPGKDAGLTRDSWGDICVGDMPIIDLWIMDNLAEATLARRRSYAQLVDHLVPPAVGAELGGEQRALHDDIEKLRTLEDGALKQRYRIQVSAGIRAAKLDGPLGLVADSDGQFGEAAIQRVDTHLHELYEATTPISLHVLGQPPPDQQLPAWLTAILGQRFLDHLAAVQAPGVLPDDPRHRRVLLRRLGEDLLRGALFAGAGATTIQGGSADLDHDLDFARAMLAKLRDTAHEPEGLLRALDGRYLQPGPGPDPIRNPASVPGGRNLYALNPEEIPTRPAWEVAVRLVDDLLRSKHPAKIGMDLNGMNTMRDFGVMEAQILYLMGVRPVWDRSNLAIDLELIPAAELKRPRVDVFVAMGGLYKENFPSRVELIDRAVRLAASADEPDNGVRAGTRALAERLRARGVAADQIEQLATARIFGTKPGNMSGTNILYLVPRSGVWEKDSEIADVYIDSMSYVYTRGRWGERVDGLYQDAIQGVDTLIRVWSSNLTSELSNHHAYEYLGGLSMAVTKLTGHQPEALIADVRDPSGARMRDFQEVLATSLRTELLNRTWIDGMKEHGYAGAGHVAELVKNTFGWAVTRPGSISDDTWKELLDTYVKDTRQLGTRAWFERDNPHALQELAATMLEAARKGYWHASSQDLAELAHVYGESVAKHGESGGLVTGGNTAFAAYVKAVLAAPGHEAGHTATASPPAPAAAPTATPPASPPPAAPAATPAPSTATAARAPAKTAEIDGRKLIPNAPPAQPPPGAFPFAQLGAALLVLLLVVYGFAKRKGAL